MTVPGIIGASINFAILILKLLFIATFNIPIYTVPFYSLCRFKYVLPDKFNHYKKFMKQSVYFG